MCQLNWVTSSCQDEDYTLIETKIILLWDILSKRKKNQCSLTKLNRAIPRHSLLEKKISIIQEHDKLNKQVISYELNPMTLTHHDYRLSFYATDHMPSHYP